MPSSSLPLEIIQLVLSFLSQQNLAQLLVSPPTHDWLYAAASVVYRRLIFTNTHQLKTCTHLFEQTRKGRRLGNHGFYSTINYALFVRQIDLSCLTDKIHLTNAKIINLTMDCANLSQLNLYNCYRITDDTMKKILQKCPRLERLSLAGATSLTVSCFLSSKGQCAHLRTLNLNLMPYFFQMKRHGSDSLPVFPKLQELKLGKMMDKTDWIPPLTRLMERCANVTRLRLDTLTPSAIDICLDHCLKINAITFRRCIFSKGMLLRLVTTPRGRQLERLELDQCHTISDFNELADGDYSRLRWFGCRRTRTMDSDVLTRLVNTGMSRMDCPGLINDATLALLVARSPALTHLSVYLQPDRLTWKNVELALTVWQKSLVWLELSGDDGSMLDYLCTWPNHVNVLLLDRMTLSLETLRRLSGCFTSTRYLLFKVALTDDYTTMELEHVLRSWASLKGVYCVNQDQIMAATEDTWQDWAWLDANKDRFRRWEDKDLISC